jgi:hypothetical protein
MKKTFFEWLWRLAVLVALGGIGLQLQRLHEDITQPPEDTTVAGAPDDLQEGLDAIRDDLDALTRKVDAIMVVMMRGAKTP